MFDTAKSPFSGSLLLISFTHKIVTFKTFNLTLQGPSTDTFTYPYLLFIFYSVQFRWMPRMPNFQLVNAGENQLETICLRRPFIPPKKLLKFTCPKI